LSTLITVARWVVRATPAMRDFFDPMGGENSLARLAQGVPEYLGILFGPTGLV
jgi:hypothetical protein